MNGLPEAVRKQAERAEALTKELSERGSKDTEESTQDAQDEGTQEVKEPEKEGPKRDEWKDKYSTLQGKYNAEVPRLQQELRQMRESLNTMSQQLQAKHTETETPDPSDLNPDAFDEYGDEFKQLAQTIKDQKAEIATLRGTMGEVVKGQNQNKEERFWGAISSRVPDWQEQNANPDFLNWLGEIVPGSRWRRQDLLDDAQKQLDTDRVVSIFQSYPGRKQPQKKRSAVESQVAPVSGGVDNSGHIQTPQTYSRADITAFYRLKSSSSFPFRFKGKIIKNQDAARQIESEMLSAAGSGNVS